MKRNAITDEELDYVWSSCQKHESTSLELTGTCLNLCTVIDVKYLTYIAERLTTKRKAAINTKELELMQTMGRRTSTVDNSLKENQKRVIQFFWDYLFEDGDSSESEE
mmetsp:Transcript_27557/g.34211  ORF Transcript_27557/g.34211 Transcript_27557/m.34211 type:complete len:108 (-) Transcript_27557:615-938(-)